MAHRSIAAFVVLASTIMSWPKNEPANIGRLSKVASPNKWGLHCLQALSLITVSRLLFCPLTIWPVWLGGRHRNRRYCCSALFLLAPLQANADKSNDNGVQKQDEPELELSPRCLQHARPRQCCPSSSPFSYNVGSCSLTSRLLVLSNRGP